MYLIFVVGEFYLYSCQLSVFLLFASLTSGENLNGASLFNISISLINGLNLKKKRLAIYFSFVNWLLFLKAQVRV